MLVLQDGLAGIKRNATTIALYIGVVVVASLLVHTAIVRLGIVPGEDISWTVQGILLILSTIQAAVMSAAQAVVFSRLGADMDRPLWRSAGDQAALREFFWLWFTINLIGVLIGEAMQSAARANNEDALTFLLLLLILYMPAAILVGACFMYHRPANADELSQSLAPIGSQFRYVLAVLFLGLVQFGAFLWVTTQLDAAETESSLVLRLLNTATGMAFMAFLDCWMFTSSWRICMMHRDTALLDSNDYLDF